MKKFNFVASAVAVSIAFFVPSGLFAQQPLQIASISVDRAVPAEAGSPAAAATPAMAGAAVAPVTPFTKPRPLTERWLDLTTLSHSERFRNATLTGGTRDFDNAQARSLIEGKIKLDAEGRYGIGFRASSGRYFNWAFSNYTGAGFIPRVTSPQASNAFTPAENQEVGLAALADPAGVAFLGGGIQSNGWEFYMRELYLTATPIKPVTVEFGSFGIERGYSTEITTFDDDGYLSGERIRLHDPKHLFFDEVSFTNAYFGDFAIVNLFDRGSSLKEFNYRQISAKKRLNDRVAFSGEYTWQTNLSTLRQAAVVGVKESKIVDSVRFEVYERINSITFPGAASSPAGPIAPLTVAGGAGFAIAAEKKFGRLSGDAGFASVDANYSVYANSRFVHAVDFPFNGDTYGVGNRPFVHASFKITPAVSAFGYYTHTVGSEHVVTLNQQGLNAGMNFNLKALINAKKEVF